MTNIKSIITILFAHLLIVQVFSRGFSIVTVKQDGSNHRVIWNHPIREGQQSWRISLLFDDRENSLYWNIYPKEYGQDSQFFQANMSAFHPRPFHSVYSHDGTDLSKYGNFLYHSLTLPSSAVINRFNLTNRTMRRVFAGMDIL